MSNNLHFKTLFIPGEKNLALYFLFKFSRTNFTLVLLWVLLVSAHALSKLEPLPPWKSQIFQYLVLQQGAAQLQTSSANLWMFQINITSPWRIHFPLLNPSELSHYRVTYIVLSPSIKFWSSSSYSLSLASVTHTSTFSVCVLQATRC